MPPARPVIGPIASDVAVHLSVVNVNPDSMWSWIVMLAAFWCQVVFGGTVFSIGQFVEVVATEFGNGKAETSLFASLFGGFTFFVGPLVSVLADWYSFRTVTICGSLISGFGLAVSYFAQSIYVLCFTYGFIGGVGSGMIFVPATIVTSFYFVRWRSFAVCIAVCGTGVGGLFYPIMIDQSITSFGWRMTMVLEGALMLTCSIPGLLYRPIQRFHVSVDTHEVIRRVDDTPKKSILQILDRSLFRSPSYVMVIVSNCLYMFMLLSVYVYLPAHAKEIGVDPKITKLLITFINITNILGRVLSGIVTNYQNKKALLLTNIVLTAGGCSLLMITTSPSTALQIICCLLFGTTIGVIFALRPLILIELLGIERLTSAFGILMFIQGIAVLSGPPLSGLMAKFTGTSRSVMLMAGSLTLLAGFITYPLYLVNHWEKKRKTARE